MNSIDLNWLLVKIVLTGPLLFSITVHELAHARTALAFGDDTAKKMGRCTLNPLAHLDPIGTITLLICGFGWAKPVQVNPYKLRDYRMGSIAIAAAGPASNLMLAIVFAFVFRGLAVLTSDMSSATLDIIRTVALWTVAVNVCLCVFNLLPLYPLDGHHIWRHQLSGDGQVAFMQWQLRYGRFVLMALIIGPFVGRSLGVDLPSPIGFVLHHSMDFFERFIIFPS